LGPVYLFFGLFWAKRRGRLFKVDLSAAQSSLQYNPLFKRKFGVFYEQYRESAYWYEAVAITRRVIAAAVWKLADRESRYPVLTLLNLCWCALHFWLKPFREQSVNLAESISLALSVGIGVVATAYHSRDEFPPGAQAVLFLIFVLPATLYFLYMVLLMLRQRAETIRRVASRIGRSVGIELTSPSQRASKPSSVSEPSSKQAAASVVEVDKVSLDVAALSDPAASEKNTRPTIPTTATAAAEGAEKAEAKEEEELRKKSKYKRKKTAAAAEQQ